MQLCAARSRATVVALLSLAFFSTAAIVKEPTATLAAPAPAPAPGPAPAPMAPYGESFFEMTSTDLSITKLLKGADPGVFALAVAARLQLVTGLPLARFALMIPDSRSKSSTPSLGCVSEHCQRLTGPEAARFATEDNTTFICKPLDGLSGTGSLLQRGAGLDRLRAAAAAASWNVGVFPATDIAGDDQDPIDLANSMTEATSTGSTLPERHLLPSGLWEMKPSIAYKFAALFPGTIDTETSIELGPNPGGWGAIATTPPPPGQEPIPEPTSEADYLASAHQINSITGSKFNKMVNFLKAAAKARVEALSGGTPFDTVEPSGALLPSWSSYR